MTIQDSTHTIAHSAKRFFTGTAISRLSGLAREVAMAIVFGTHPVIAAFWMAFRFSHLLRRLFGEGALHAAFVPHFEKLRKQDPRLGARFFYALSSGVTFLLFAITLLTEGVLGSLLLFGSIAESTAQVIQLTMVMMPAVIFISLYALNTSLLQCERSYFLPSVAPTLLNCVWVVSIFLFWQLPIEKAVEYLAMVVVLAFALQWGVTVPSTYRYLKTNLGSEKEYSKREMMQVIRPFMIGMIGVAATQINTACDALFARWADAQGPAYLWYAMRIQQLPLALLGIGLTGALLPPIARAIEQKNHVQVAHFLQFALKKAIVFMIPMTAALFALGFCGINLVYGHGNFSQEAVYQTTLCLWAYSLSLLPTTCVLILASAYYANKNYRLPTLFSLITVGVNLLLNTLFVFQFHWGALSIALSTALASFINAALLYKSLSKEHTLTFTGLSLETRKVILASTLSIAATLYIGTYFQDHALICLQPAIDFPRALNVQLLSFGAQSLTFTATFLICAYPLRLFSLNSFTKTK